jgi:iron complex transport system substrate-binding protein
MRIVSLLPAATEFVAALGATDELVGVSHECDEPPAVLRLPRLTRTRIGPAAGSRGIATAASGGIATAASGEIDRSVRAMAARGLSLFELDAARLRALAPDVVITQDLCEVCAVSRGEVESSLRELAGREVALVALSPMRLEDVFGDLHRVARALGREPEAAALEVRLRARVDAVRRRARAAWDRPRTVTVEWIDPVMLGGTWMPELVELAGGAPVGAVAGEKASQPARELLDELDAEALLLKPCGLSLDAALAELDVARKTLPLERWPALSRGRAVVADGSQYFNRPGPRLVDSLELLAAALHPDLFADFARRYAPAARRLAPDGSLDPF